MTTISQTKGPQGLFRKTRAAWISSLAVVMFALMVPPAVAKIVQFQGGPVMKTPIKVFLIFWRGPCPSSNSKCTRSFDLTVNGGIGNYETVIRRFFNDVGGTGYFNILSQYFGACPKGSNSTCVPRNFGGAVVVPSDGLFDDPISLYPHAGTTDDPLQDGDIRDEIKRALASHPSWSTGPSSEFFVFTPVGMQECAQGCTFATSNPTFCAYHDSFSSNGLDVIYGFMPADFSRGCSKAGTPNGQSSTDQEIVVMSHEFFESVSDPLAQSDTAWNGNTGEIGDQCTAALGAVRSDGSNVTLGGNRYVVQQNWSNDPLQFGCLLSFGPTAQIATTTGSDNLRSNSTLTATFVDGTNSRTVNANPTQATWDNSSTQTHVFAVPRTTLDNLTETLTSHPDIAQSDDGWNLQSIDLRLLTPSGDQICEQSAFGNPLARVSDGKPFKFNTPNCSSPSPSTTFDSVEIDIQTGNDDARSDVEITGTLSGQSHALCLKPSTSLSSDGICNNGSNASDHNGHATWDNWSFNNQTFRLPTPVSSASAFGTLNVAMLQSGSGGGCGGCDNWDIQSIRVSVFNSKGPQPPLKTLLGLSKPANGDNCLARLKAPPDNARTVSFSLDGTENHIYVGGKQGQAGKTTNCSNNGD